MNNFNWEMNNKGYPFPAISKTSPNITDPNKKKKEKIGKRD